MNSKDYNANKLVMEFISSRMIIRDRLLSNRGDVQCYSNFSYVFLLIRLATLLQCCKSYSHANKTICTTTITTATTTANPPVVIIV